MSRLGNAARRIVGVESPAAADAFDAREHDRAIAAARAKLERCQAELARANELHAAKLEAAKRAREELKANRDDAAVMAVHDAQNEAQRATILVDAAREDVTEAAAELDAAEVARAQAEFDFLSRRNATSERIRDRLTPKLAELERVAAEINALVSSEVERTMTELRRAATIYEQLHGKAWPAGQLLINTAFGQRGIAKAMLSARLLQNPAIRWLERL